MELICLLPNRTDETVAVSAIKEEYRDKIKAVVDNGILKIYYVYNTSLGHGIEIKEEAKSLC